MAFCTFCGNQLADGAAFCGACGKPVIHTAQQDVPVQESPVQEAPQQPYQQPYEQPYQQQTYQQQAYQQQPYQQPVQPIYDDVAQSRGVAWLAYLGPLFLIPLFVKKQFRFARFHVKEGATLFACELAYSITTSILLTLIDLPTREYYFYGVYVHSGLYDVMNVILNLAHVFFVVCAIMGIVRAATGKRRVAVPPASSKGKAKRAPRAALRAPPRYRAP